MIKRNDFVLGLLTGLCFGFFLGLPINALAAEEAQIRLQLPSEMVLDLPLDFMTDNNAQVFATYGAALTSVSIKKWTFKVQGYGGYAIILNKFVQSIQDAQKQGKTINMEIIGPSYSAHALVTCYADHVNMREGSSVMFHSISSQQEYFFGLVSYSDSSLDPSSMIMQSAMFKQCKSKGILTDSDIKFLEANGDITIGVVDGVLVRVYASDPARGLKLTSDIVTLLGALFAFIFVVGLVKRV